MTIEDSELSSSAFGKTTALEAMFPFIPAADLKQTYGVFGHFYSVELASREVVECRSVLELVAKPRLPKDHSELSALSPDAVFIMMNPGSSRPLVEVNNRIRARAIHKLAISLVPTKPDTTQYQVMRLMQVRQWRHVRVLNLSDLRSAKSAEFIKLFQRLERDEAFNSHSVFSDARAEELLLKLPTKKTPTLVSPLVPVAARALMLSVTSRLTVTRDWPSAPACTPR